MPKTKQGPLAAGKAVDVSTLVGRLRTSYPVLRTMAVDSALRQLLLAELVSQCYREGCTNVDLTGVHSTCDC